MATEHYFIVVHTTDNQGNRKWRLDHTTVPPKGKFVYDDERGWFSPLSSDPDTTDADAVLYGELADAIDNINNNLF
jgi:hypothetical protein